MPGRLFLADGQRLLVQVLSGALAHRFAVVGSATSGEEVLSGLAATRPNGLVLDLELPVRNGLTLIPEVKERWPAVHVLVLTRHADRILATAAFQAGADGFIPKHASFNELVESIRTVLAGGRYLYPKLPKWSNRIALAAWHSWLACLTPRQQQVVELIGMGRTTKEIASCLNLSMSTVTLHRQNVRLALGLDSEWELVRFSILVQLASSSRGMPESA